MMNRNRTKGLRTLALVVTLVSSAASRANPANLSLTPSLSFSEAYDSNIFNSATNPQSDYIFRALPALTLSLTAWEARVNITGAFMFNYYADHQELNNTSQALTKNFNIALDKSLGKSLQITPTVSITPEVRFVTSYDYVQRNAVTRYPMAGIPSSNTFVTNQSGDSTSVGGSIVLDYKMTPTLSSSLTGAVYRQLFSVSNPIQVNSTYYSVTPSVYYQITPRFSSGVYFTAGLDRFDNGNESRTYTVGLSGLYALAENYTANIGIGATNYQNYVDNGVSDNQGWSPQINGTLNYTLNTFNASLYASYQISGGGSFGTTARTGNIVLDLTDQFTERWGWGIYGHYQRNRSTNNSIPVNYSTVGGTVNTSYQVASWASAQLSGNIFRQMTSNAGGDINRYYVMLGASIGYVYSILGNAAEAPGLDMIFPRQYSY